jgi:alpha-beta hydrolase superfamily lysophospholipase
MVSQRAPELFNFTYGLFNWFLFAFLAIWSGSFFHRSSEKERNELSLGTVIYFSPPASVLSREQADQDLLERDKLWNLTKSWSGFKHYFLNLRDGIKIHYVTNEEPDSNSAKTKPLFIFIHGFPDSWALWRHLLHSELRHLGILVALDLPGYGGSDSLTNYGATEVFEALAQFILDIREKYGFDADDRGNGERKVYIVGHDWGCALGCRLACEAPDLADRFILSNAPMVRG